MTDTDRADTTRAPLSDEESQEQWRAHMESRGIKHPAKLGSQATRPDTTVTGEPITYPTAETIDVGDECWHATLRWAPGGIEGTFKGGVVVHVWTEDDGRRMVKVAEAQHENGRLIVRVYTWPTNELDPTTMVRRSQSANDRAAKTLLEFAATANRKAWTHTGPACDDVMVAGALALTEPFRRIVAERAAQRSATCAAGHCTDEGGECSGASDHVGICCWCSATVSARVKGRVAS